MALEKCSECGQAVSTRARACPHCGAPAPSCGRRQRMGLALAALVTGVSVALTTGTANHSRGPGIEWAIVTAVVLATVAVLFLVLGRRG